MRTADLSRISSPLDIPRLLTLADVHLALAHYFRDPEAIDAEIKREMAFNSRDSLSSSSMTLPGVGLKSLVEFAS